MKLELKHLAGYLPYGLKYKDIPKGFDGIRELDIQTFNWCLENGKPILHPLSDLTKEIEINGEKFVPVVEIMKIKDNGDWLGVQHKKIEENPFYVVKKLQEWHFDIDDLIGKKLAIDINTLEK